MKSPRLVPFVLALVAAGSGPAPSADAQAQANARILYSSDWSGTAQIYAVDPSGKSPTGQITFGRAPVCRESPTAPCGFSDPTPSPDGRKLFFWDFVAGGPWLRRSLFVANADGRSRRRVAVTEGSIVGAVWSPDSRRLAYWGNHGIHVVGADGSGDRLLPTSNSGDRSPAWSADGRSIAFIDAPRGDFGAADLVVVTGKQRRAIAQAVNASSFAWSPADRWIAFGAEGVHIARPDGTGRRRVADGRHGFAWSPDGRRLALGGDGVRVYDLRSRKTRRVTDAGAAILWSPDGRMLAGRTAGWIEVVDVTTGKTRRLTPASGERLSWAPDSRSLAYVHREFGYHPLGKLEFRIVGLNGENRTIVSAGDRHGGTIAGMVWVRPPSGVRYRKPRARSLATISGNELTAPWSITRLATDGGRVAYAACGHVFVWTPSARTVQQAELVTSLAPWCSPASEYSSRAYALAVADDRVAYGSVYGGAHSRTWWLGWVRTGARDMIPLDCELGVGTANPQRGAFIPVHGRLVGELVGSGRDLFYSSWGETGPAGAIVTTVQQVLRATPDACPGSSVYFSEGGPLVPLDADSSRVAAVGDNETWVLDRSGAIVARVPVPLLAAQLSEADLVGLRRGELRHYDATTGALLHVWPLADVTTGRECGSPNVVRCGPNPRLLLQDLARGLVAYVLDGQVHLMRLSDGADAVVASGSLARFLDAGLVYADGSRLRLVRFGELPLP